MKPESEDSSSSSSSSNSSSNSESSDGEKVPLEGKDEGTSTTPSSQEETQVSISTQHQGVNIQNLEPDLILQNEGMIDGANPGLEAEMIDADITSS